MGAAGRPPARAWRSRLALASLLAVGAAAPVAEAVEVAPAAAGREAQPARWRASAAEHATRRSRELSQQRIQATRDAIDQRLAKTRGADPESPGRLGGQRRQRSNNASVNGPRPARAGRWEKSTLGRGWESAKGTLGTLWDRAGAVLQRPKREPKLTKTPGQRKEEDAPKVIPKRPGQRRGDDATLVFENEDPSAGDFDVFFLRPVPHWPPAPAREPEAAVRVRCRFGRRAGGRAGTVAELRSDLRVRGELNVTVRLDWSPGGSRHFLALVGEGFFDGSCIFRAAGGGAAQFGVSHDGELRERLGGGTIPDDPARGELLPLRRGALAFAGEGAGSRATRIQLALEDGAFGERTWETPIGYVHSRGGLEDVDGLSAGYGDTVGGEPDPALMEEEGGLDYLLNGWPNLDCLESCVAMSNVREEGPEMFPPKEVFVGTAKAGGKLRQRTTIGHRFVARPRERGKRPQNVSVTKQSEIVHLSIGSEL